MSRKSSADEGPLHSPRPSPCNETEKNKQTKHNRKNQKPNKEQQPNQNRGHCRRLGPYTVALPVAISHKVSLKPKLCASATLIQKTSKNQPKHGPQKWDRLAVPFLAPHAQLSKRTKEKALSRSHFWDRLAVPKMRLQNRKIHSKGRPLQQTKKLQLGLLKQSAYRFGTEEARTCETWFSIDFPAPKWNLKAHMWYQLSPFPSSKAMQQHPGNIHQSFATPRYSATPCYVFIQLPNVFGTRSKRWRSKKAFNTSPSHIFSEQIPTPVLNLYY